MAHIQTEKIVVFGCFWGIRHSTKARQTATCSETLQGQQIKSKVTVGVLWDVVSVLSFQDSSKFMQISSVPSRYLFKT